MSVILSTINNKHLKTLRTIFSSPVASSIIWNDIEKLFRSEDLIIPESMAQDFGFTGVLEKQAHSRLRNCFSSASVESKDQSDSGIIEFSFLIALDCKITQGRGSRVRVMKNGIFAVFHRPHPAKETNKGAVISVREFLTKIGVKL